MAHLFVQFRLGSCGRRRRMVKAVRDNFHAVSRRAEVLLGSIRALLREDRIRYISGRPRKRSSPSAFFPDQLLPPLF